MEDRSNNNFDKMSDPSNYKNRKYRPPPDALFKVTMNIADKIRYMECDWCGNWFKKSVKRCPRCHQKNPDYL